MSGSAVGRSAAIVVSQWVQPCQKFADNAVLRRKSFKNCSIIGFRTLRSCCACFSRPDRATLD
eukprot:10314427-Alexandrium_andersonii.AAC.1